jgi:hypothetical protein
VSGKSGSRTAKHTNLVRFASSGNRYFITKAQARIISRAKAGGGACYVKGSEVRSARALVARMVATLRDDGAFGRDKSSNVDGERWWFELKDGVTVENGLGYMQGRGAS